MGKKLKILCKLPWTRIIVYANGDFKHCCYQAKPVANINDGSFDEVWNNNNSIKIREAILNGELDETFCICVKTIGHIPNFYDKNPHIPIEKTEKKNSISLPVIHE